MKTITDEDLVLLYYGEHDDPALATRYGDRVPVLLAGDTELCCHFLDEDRLREYCRGA